jgi:hypothetical protein
MGVARTIFVRGLPYKYDRAAIRNVFAKYGVVDSIIIEKQRPGTATITYKEALSASHAIVKLDTQNVGKLRLKVQCAKLFSAPLDDGNDDGADGESDTEQEQMECPISFSGRGTKSGDRTTKIAERRWKSADGMVWCEMCGRRGHFSQGCPLTLQSYHQQVVSGTVPAGVVPDVTSTVASAVASTVSSANRSCGQDTQDVDEAMTETASSVVVGGGGVNGETGVAGEAPGGCLGDGVAGGAAGAGVGTGRGRGRGRGSLLPAWAMTADNAKKAAECTAKLEVARQAEEKAMRERMVKEKRRAEHRAEKQKLWEERKAKQQEAQEAEEAKKRELEAKEQAKMAAYYSATPQVGPTLLGTQKVVLILVY